MPDLVVTVDSTTKQLPESVRTRLATDLPPGASSWDDLEDMPAVIAAGGPYLKGYILDTLFAGIHFCFSGYFTANGRSEISFLHNITSTVCARIPLAYLASRTFPHTLLPMGLATASGSLVSVGICLVAYRVLKPRFVGAGR